MLKFAQKHVMSAQQASSLQSSIGKAARAFKIVLVIAPALQASWGNGLDGVQNLMTKGIHVAGGDRLGKTIIFAANQRHADFIAERFDVQYPHLKGAFARIITHRTEPCPK